MADVQNVSWLTTVATSDKQKNSHDENLTLYQNRIRSGLNVLGIDTYFLDLCCNPDQNRFSIPALLTNIYIIFSVTAYYYLLRKMTFCKINV